MAKSMKSLFSFLNVFGKTKKRSTRRMRKTRKHRKSRKHMRGG
jgi:hypothetical protein|uniref:Uncharacterized protein n=1 Tax=viral metagenome TaxID=1070528 RepID=A0A6C0DAT5_9ZZZZ